VEQDRNRSHRCAGTLWPRARVLEFYFIFFLAEGRSRTFLRLKSLPQRETDAISRFIGGVYFTSAFQDTLAQERGGC